MEVEICNCNPEAHHQIISTDVKLLRRVRKYNLEDAKRWEKCGAGMSSTVVCARYTAHLCLLRIRELTKGVA